MILFLGGLVAGVLGCLVLGAAYARRAVAPRPQARAGDDKEHAAETALAILNPSDPRRRRVIAHAQPKE